MNAKRRKQLEILIDKLEFITRELEDLKELEEAAFENMPEGLQESERGQAMQEIIDMLDSAITDSETLSENLSEIVTTGQ